MLYHESVRRLFLMAAWAASAVLLWAAQDDAPLSADQIVQKHVEALGGAAKLNAIQSLVVTGTASILGQTEAPITIQVKRPNMMRLEITFQGRKIVQAFDGVSRLINQGPDPRSSKYCTGVAYPVTYPKMIFQLTSRQRYNFGTVFFGLRVEV